MRYSFVFLIGLLLLIGVGAALQGAQGADAQGRQVACTFRHFEADIRQGPTKGLRLYGTLRLTASAAGVLSGGLRSEDGQVYVEVSGRVKGRAINLAFDFGYSGRTQAYLFAVGTLWEPFSACSGMMGGLFTGPQQGDIGDWWVGASS